MKGATSVEDDIEKKSVGQACKTLKAETHKNEKINYQLLIRNMYIIPLSESTVVLSDNGIIYWSCSKWPPVLKVYGSSSEKPQQSATKLLQTISLAYTVVKNVRGVQLPHSEAEKRIT